MRRLTSFATLVSHMIPICVSMTTSNEIVGRAYQRVNLLFRSFVSQNVSILTRAFLTYVRPILEFCTSIWSPHQSYLIDKIERVQRYFTRRVLFRTKFSYIERLQILNLELVEARRIKSDLKLCFKIVNGLCDFDVDAFFKFAPQTSVTRGHNKKNWLIQSVTTIGN